MANTFYMKEIYFGCWQVGDNLSENKYNRKADDKTLANDSRGLKDLHTYNIIISTWPKVLPFHITSTPENPKETLLQHFPLAFQLLNQINFACY